MYDIFKIPTVAMWWGVFSVRPRIVPESLGLVTQMDVVAESKLRTCIEMKLWESMVNCLWRRESVKDDGD